MEAVYCHKRCETEFPPKNYKSAVFDYFFDYDFCAQLFLSNEEAKLPHDQKSILHCY